VLIKLKICYNLLKTASYCHLKSRTIQPNKLSQLSIPLMNQSMLHYSICHSTTSLVHAHVQLQTSRYSTLIMLTYDLLPAMSIQVNSVTFCYATKHNTEQKKS